MVVVTVVDDEAWSSGLSLASCCVRRCRYAADKDEQAGIYRVE